MLPQSDEHHRFIVETTCQFYERHDRPILLSDLGTLFSHQFGRFSSQHDISLKEYVEQHCQDELVVVGHPHILQKLYLAPVDKAEAATQFAAATPAPIPPEDPTSKAPGELQLARLQRAILFAFQIVPGEGETVYVSLNPPFRFVKRSDAPTPEENFLPIEPEYSLRSGRPKQAHHLAEEEQRQLNRKILGWAQKHDVDLRRFYFTPIASRPVSADTRRADSNALQRLLDAQPDDVKKRLLLPADIIQYLLNMRWLRIVWPHTHRRSDVASVGLCFC